MGHEIQEELAAFVVLSIKEEEEDKYDGCSGRSDESNDDFDWGSSKEKDGIYYRYGRRHAWRRRRPMNDDNLYILSDNSIVYAPAVSRDSRRDFALAALLLLFRLQIEGVPADKKKARCGYRGRDGIW
jgi:hypothetical protein